MSDPELERILAEKMKRMVTGSMSSESGSLVRLTVGNFDQYINGDKPVLVDFWAEWCGPCRVMEPVIARLAAKYHDKVVFGKLNVDEEPTLATRYDVLSIPTFIILKNGKPLDALVGAVGERAIEQFVQKAINKPDVYR